MVQVFYVNLIYLNILFIWLSLQYTIFNGLDGAGRLISLISILVFIINIRYNKLFFSGISIKIWFLWFIYASINTLFLFDENHVGISKDIFILNYLFAPLVVMSIVASFKEKKINVFLQYMEYNLYFVVFIFFFGSKINDGTYSNDLFNINELVLFVIALIATILINSIKKNRSITRTIILMIFPTFFVVMSGSRMGFGAYLILILGFWFVKKKKNGFIFIFKLFFTGIISFFLINFIIENTVLGERLMNTTSDTDTLIDNTAEGTIFEHFGDRGLYYINGWYIYKEHPLFGIGLMNYSKKYPYVLHVEYMIQLAELGTIGFLIYLLFLYSIFSNLLKIYKIKEEKLFLFFILFSILFSASVLFLYKSFAISYLFGLIILFINSRNRFSPLLGIRYSEIEKVNCIDKKNYD